MANDKVKREKLHFIKSPNGTGYHKGMVADVPVDMAKDFKERGLARPATEVLPDDFPHRDDLIKAGVDTVSDVKDLAESDEGLQSVDGIGEAGEKEITKALKSIK